MSTTSQASDSPDTTVAVTLHLDARVYESFLQKAKKAGVGIESYLGSTLSIVLGCRVFNETLVCSPQITDGKDGLPVSNSADTV